MQIIIDNLQQKIEILNINLQQHEDSLIHIQGQQLLQQGLTIRLQEVHKLVVLIRQPIEVRVVNQQEHILVHHHGRVQVQEILVQGVQEEDNKKVENHLF